MPIYQYQCNECGHQMEALQKMSDAKLVDCPACQQPALRKQLTAAAFKLKGTGWYETDFKNSGQPPANKTDTKKSTSAEPSAAGSSTSASLSSSATEAGSSA